MNLEQRIECDWLEAVERQDRHRKKMLGLVHAEIEAYKYINSCISEDTIHLIITDMIEERKSLLAQMRGRGLLKCMVSEAIEVIILDSYLPESVI